MRSGFTLLELAFVLLVWALLATGLHAPLQRTKDRLATAAARDAVSGLLRAARMTAPGTWGASVHVAGPPWRAWMEAGDSVARRVAISEDFGVDVSLSGGRGETSMAFDALGIGRVASETLRFRRGEAESVLVVSAYGRLVHR